MKRRSHLLAVLGLGVLGLAFASYALAEVAQKGSLRVAFSGSFTPKKLPRTGEAPIAVRLGGDVSTTDGTDPPGLDRIEISISRGARIDPEAMPTCSFAQIQPSSTTYARKVCASARVGQGQFNAAVSIPEESPYPSRGTVTAFNGVEHGKPVIYLHIYGTEPLPTSFTLPLSIGRGHGSFGTILRGNLPSVDAHVGFVTGISVTLNNVTRHGRSYLSAGCPAPEGFPGTSFPLARASFFFYEGPTLSETLVRNCRVR
ncbi:MAG TPA: hypothetical protein VFN85_02385 [Solirubrobacterales bacterium]|nr:hypothetical protein [Solirubrobacterales bacterium]